MHAKRTETATARTTAHNGDGVTDHLPCGDLPLVARVRPPRERQGVDAIHLCLSHGVRRRFDQQCPCTVKLDQLLGMLWVGFPLHGSGGVAEEFLLFQ